MLPLETDHGLGCPVLDTELIVKHDGLLCARLEVHALALFSLLSRYSIYLPSCQGLCSFLHF